MANIKHLKRLNRQQALKIRRLQAQAHGANAAVRGAVNSNADRYREEAKGLERDLSSVRGHVRTATSALQKIATMSRAKEARETAGAALAQIGK